MYGPAVPSVSDLDFSVGSRKLQFTKAQDWEKIYQFRGFVGFWDIGRILARDFAFNNRSLRFAGCTLGKTEASVF